MSKEELLAEILQLPPEERQELINDALESLPLEFTLDSGMTSALWSKLNNRYQEMLKYPARASSWEEVSKRILARNR